jgi:hypothetical protein
MNEELDNLALKIGPAMGYSRRERKDNSPTLLAT